MSIKTIKKRENHKVKTYEATCKICGSDFEAAKDDLTITFGRGEQCIQRINCPECDKYGLSFRVKETKGV